MSETLRVGDIVGPHVTEYGRKRLDALPDGTVVADQHARLTKCSTESGARWRPRWSGARTPQFRTMHLVGPVEVLSIPEETR